jgi:hypothetical protein
MLNTLCISIPYNYHIYHAIFKLVEEPVAQAPPHLEPIVPNSGNGLKTKPFTWLYESE